MSKVMKATREQADYLLYFGVGTGIAWQAADYGLDYRAIAGALIAGLLALKAKRSRDDSPPQGQGK